MAQKWARALFIFRRDLRAHDNKGLQHALERTSNSVHPLFVFDPRQCSPLANDYFNHNSFRFMVESLTELEGTLDMNMFHGVAHRVVEALVDSSSAAYVEGIDAVVVNKDYTPFSQARDEAIADVCRRCGVEFVCLPGDAVLREPESVRTGTDNMYKVFTPFYKKTAAMGVERSVDSWPLPDSATCTVQRVKDTSDVGVKSALTDDVLLLESASSIYELLGSELDHKKVSPHTGGRQEGLALLQKAAGLKKYGDKRDDLTIAFGENGSSHLAPHLKFGTVSIREAFWRLRSIEMLTRQLYWREFYLHLAYNFPTLLKGQRFRAQLAGGGGSVVKREGVDDVEAARNGNMQDKFDAVWWDESEEKFAAWCEGKTGFPIVDAGMRQLITSGEMHNRTRMVVACFLTKDLHIDWRRGEQFFAQHLTDYDPANNNGGWQWAASTGADAQPYFRVFNPWRQQERFDKDAVYIKRWVPELRSSGLSAKEIHTWEKVCKTPKGKKVPYPAPIVVHSEEAKIAKDTFASTAADAKKEEHVGEKRKAKKEEPREAKRTRR